ncbi:hypothetical protein WA577_000626 [Blastocystis sp. JDR]
MDKRGIRLCNVNLVDSFYCSNPEVFISAGLTSLVTMINLELPSVNILSKIDLISKYGDVEYDLDYYTELPDMTRMLYGVDRKNRNLDKSVPDDEDACDEEVFVKQAKDPFQQRYRKLYWMLCDIIDDYGLLSYLPLDIQSPTSVQKIVDTIDKANGYSIFESVNQNEMMSVYAKEDTKYADMVDEMNEKYVHHEDDFDDNDLIWDFAMDFDCMKKVIDDRNSVRVFNGKKIEEGVLEEILGYSLRCPTSMNTQPYKTIVIRDQEKKEGLSRCMESGNDLTVRTSGATVVVLADQEPVNSVVDYGKFVFSDDVPPKIQKLMRYAFVTYYSNTLLNVFFGWILDLGLWFFRFFRTSPARITNQAWSYQQASFLIEDMILLAQSKGISSLIMEGFSEEAVRQYLSIPKRYQIASVVSFGYTDAKDVKKTPRYDFKDMVFDGKFGKSF